MAETITADMIIHDIVSRHPETVKVFHGHGLPCTACAVGSRESVAGGGRTPPFNPPKHGQIIPELKDPINRPPRSLVPKKARVWGGGSVRILNGARDRKVNNVSTILSGTGG